MHAVRPLVAVVAAGLGASACQAPVQTFQRTFMDPSKPYIGMSKDQVLSCAGKPYNSYTTDKGETLTFHYSGAGPVPTAADTKQKTDQQNPFSKPKSEKNWKCSASLSFENGKLIRVTFSPNGVVGPYDTKKDPKTGAKIPVEKPEPCTFSLPNCTPH